MTIKKERADILLVEQGLFETREKAKRAIMAGIVYRKEERVDKPGEKIPIDSELQVKGKQMPYVSRGGLKLEKALQVFDFEVKDKLMLDIGASLVGLRTVLCKMEQDILMHWMLVIISLHGNFATTTASP